MVLKAKENSVGAWAFLSGVILAVSAGVVMPLLSVSMITRYSSQIYAILVLIGIVVGFVIRIETKDSQNFLVAATILVIVSKFGMESVTGSLIGIGIGDIVVSTFSALLALFVPATIVVAIKTVFSMAKI